MTKQNIITTAIIAGVAIISPVAGMCISPVREALLGLTPDEQILQIADTLDENRVKNEEDLATLQALVEEQKETIEAQSIDMSVLQKNLEDEKSKRTAVEDSVEELEFSVAKNSQVTEKIEADKREEEEENERRAEEEKRIKEEMKEKENELKQREDDIKKEMKDLGL